VIAADGAHRAVVEMDQGSGDVVSIVNMYEDIPFQVYSAAYRSLGEFCNTSRHSFP
jgi:hypothetical protein